MVHIPVKFKRVAAAFDEISRFRSCDESSGSEHSADLSDLVNSFFEREIGEQRSSEEHDQDGNGNDFDDDESDLSNSPDFELQDSVRNLFEGDRDDDVKRGIYTEVEKAVEGAGGDETSSPEFKRRLMARLRSSGFDAGEFLSNLIDINEKISHLKCPTLIHNTISVYKYYKRNSLIQIFKND